MPDVPQGSSLLATLGFIAESLWDSRSLASIKIRVRCRQGSRTPKRFRVPLAGPSARQVLGVRPRLRRLPPSSAAESIAKSARLLNTGIS